jgi:hypothetical protein
MMGTGGLSIIDWEVPAFLFLLARSHGLKSCRNRILDFCLSSIPVCDIAFHGRVLMDAAN